MRKVETDRKGSFIACGVGLLYKYTAPTNTLEIFLRTNRAYLFRMSLDDASSDNIDTLLHNFDKALQIKALMISIHKTNDITQTVGAEKLQAIIKGTLRVARYAFDAQTGAWDKLNIAIQQDFQLKAFKIKRLICPSAGTAYIRCHLETPRKNELTVRAKTSAEAIKSCSEKIIQDLIAVEFAYRTDSYAHKLVSMSSIMGTLSRILDADYTPAEYIRKKQPTMTKAQA